MEINQIMMIGTALVPCVAYIVTTMAFAKQNRQDILRLDDRMSSLEERMTSVGERISSLERDVAVIKAICQERSARDLPVC